MASSSICEMKGFEIQTSDIRTHPKRALFMTWVLPCICLLVYYVQVMEKLAMIFVI